MVVVDIFFLRGRTPLLCSACHGAGVGGVEAFLLDLGEAGFEEGVGGDVSVGSFDGWVEVGLHRGVGGDVGG